jgi:hypothetical protein
MKKLFRRNLFLIKRKIHLYIFYLLTIMVMLFLKKDAFSFLVFFITAMTLISLAAIEEYDANNYKTTFSMPIIRDEFAKAKALTLLLIFGVNTALSLATYIIAALLGKVIMIPFSLIVLGLSFAFLLSMISGGIALIKRDKGLFPYAVVFIIVFDNMNIPSLVLGNVILIYIISAIFIATGRTAYVIAKENILRICLEMEF